jgi:ribonuclease HI
MHLKIYTDGASRGNPGHAAIGVVIQDESSRLLKEISEYIGINTNNYAEYQAVLRALKEAKNLNADAISLFSDSELVCRQLTGKYKVKSANIRPLFSEVISLASKFKSFSVTHVRREFNTHADKLANMALDRQKKV